MRSRLLHIYPVAVQLSAALTDVSFLLDHPLAKRFHVASQLRHRLSLLIFRTYTRACIFIMSSPDLDRSFIERRNSVVKLQAVCILENDSANCKVLPPLIFFLRKFEAVDPRHSIVTRIGKGPVPRIRLPSQCVGDRRKNKGEKQRERERHWFHGVCVIVWRRLVTSRLVVVLMLANRSDVSAAARK